MAITRDDIESMTPMGISIRANEIVDDLKREYFPQEFQNLAFEGARRQSVGTPQQSGQVLRERHSSMAMEIWLLLDRRIGSIAEWQDAIDKEGFPLRLPEAVSLEEARGFLPSYLRGKLTGFEYGRCDPVQVMTDYPAIDRGHDWKYGLGFRWLGSRREEMLAAWMAATAYVRATGGVIFDEIDGKLHGASNALEIVRDLENDDRHIVDAAVANALAHLKSRE